MALCNVLQFFVNTGDKRLSSVIVQGERVFQHDEGNKPTHTRYADFPVLHKTFSWLIVGQRIVLVR